MTTPAYGQPPQSILVLGAGELGSAILSALAAHPALQHTTLTVLLRPSTLSTNPAQLAALRALVPGADPWPSFQPNASGRFEARVAVVTALNLFFRSLGGTVGLAQCSTVMNAKVKQYFASLPASALASLQSANRTAMPLSLQGLESLQSIDALPPAIQELVKNAFRNGVRWCFISLIPWAGVSLLLVLFLIKIPDTDKASQGSAAAAPRPSEVEAEKEKEKEGEAVP